MAAVHVCAKSKLCSCTTNNTSLGKVRGREGRGEEGEGGGEGGGGRREEGREEVGETIDIGNYKFKLNVAKLAHARVPCSENRGTMSSLFRPASPYPSPHHTLMGPSPP